MKTISILDPLGASQAAARLQVIACNMIGSAIERGDRWEAIQKAGDLLNLAQTASDEARALVVALHDDSIPAERGFLEGGK